MFQHQGIWLPDGEKHFPEWMSKNGEIVDGKGTYQIKKWRAVLEHLQYPNLRYALDVGAHVGLWAMQMLKYFDCVYCFEPVPQFRKCLYKNLGPVCRDGSRAEYEVLPYALGAEEGRCVMYVDPADTGGTHVVQSGTGFEVEMRTIDSFNFIPELVNFIKIDCEGYELEVLKGARRTILASRPVIIVEQKPHKLAANYGTSGAPAVEFLRDLGMSLVKEISGDFILVWK